MTQPEAIFIVDQITPKSGMAQTFLAAYLEQYAPGARARGMKLEHSWIAPPVWLAERPNTLIFVWSLRGAANWWVTAGAARQDPAVADWWWKDAAPMIETRQRFFASHPGDLASLSNV